MRLWSLDEEVAINVGGAAYQVWLTWLMDDEEGNKVVRGKQRLCVLFFRPIGGDELASYQSVEIKKEAGRVLGICFELQCIATLFADFG